MTPLGVGRAVMLCGLLATLNSGLWSPPNATGQEYDPLDDPALEMLEVAPAVPSDASIPNIRVYYREQFDQGVVAWGVIASCASLFLIAPGLIGIYAGLFPVGSLHDRGKEFVFLVALLSVVWALGIYSLSYSRNIRSYDLDEKEVGVYDREGAPGNRFLGGLDHVGMEGLESRLAIETPRYPLRHPDDQIPHLIFMVLQMMIFVRVPLPWILAASRRLTWMRLTLLVLLWSLLVYAPIVYWLRGGGWLSATLDASGGLPVHVSAGFAALSVAWLYRRAERDPVASREVRSQLLVGGTLLIWAGTMLTSAGIGVVERGAPAVDLVSHHLAACGGGIAWTAADWLVRGRPDLSRSCLGVITGLVAMAAGSGFVGPPTALMIGVTGGVVGNVALGLVQKWAPRNPFPVVFALQGVPGAWGVLMVGVFAMTDVGGLDRAGQVTGGWIEGHAERIVTQLLALAVVAGWALIVTPALACLVRLLPEGSRRAEGQRATPERDDEKNRVANGGEVRE